ncbi:hypothetical protein [Candidatus Entotheonella palauensis]|uniref:hypothetical protein n=1 Tax=Candidatus Entotheonella palauensis TaxID=93172 RepID=UPI000B7D60FC|nr:hypothetical protein [Candidatus Entotheonella palauensis]
MNDEFESAESGFLDIASNTLAVVLIVTMISLLSIRSHTRASTDPRAVVDPTVEFRQLSSTLFGPFSTYFFVLEDRLVQWDQEGFVADLLERGPQGKTLVRAQGRLRLKGGATTPRDVNGFEAIFYLDPQGMLTDQAEWDEAQETAWLQQLVQSYERDHIAPTFIVYRSGMNRFARLYPQLRESGVRFRWYAWRDRDVFRLTRRVSDFTRFRFLW